ncbi:MAG: hypothetical protein AB2672_13410 [Candidatus Thiodiazotropha endolucinida]
MKRIITLLIFLAIANSAIAGEPQREKGISAHALPKRVADISGQPWGLQVSYAPYLKSEPGQPYLQSVKDVLAYVEKQEKSVVENGLWVVTTHPSAYSEQETKFFEKLKMELPKHNIPLFRARGSELKNGFKSY